MTKIYIDRLKDGKIEKITEELPSSFLEVDEPELSFKEPIQIAIKAYLSEDHLVLHIDVKTTCTTPCIICNGHATQTILIKNFHHTQPLEETDTIMDCLPLLRELILLEVRTYIECSGGSCPERTQILSHLKKNDYTLSSDGNFPFANLN